jgi:D-ribose pyranase
MKGGFPRMIIQGIINPQINSLLARTRHTNMLVISDRGFPFWPMIETVDISLVDGIPTVLQVLDALRPNFRIGQIYMAQEFLDNNTREVSARFAQSTAGIPVGYEPHIEFKKRVPQAIGLIRTADTIQYANMILISA